jgi:hypothetical protein
MQFQLKVVDTMEKISFNKEIAPLAFAAKWYNSPRGYFDWR